MKQSILHKRLKKQQEQVVRRMQKRVKEYRDKANELYHQGNREFINYNIMADNIELDMFNFINESNSRNK